jgi:hypothetical protein
MRSVKTQTVSTKATIAVAPSLVDSVRIKSAGTRTRDTVISGEGLRVFVGLLPMISLLWLFLFLRVYEIDGHLPYFVDELRHIERGKIVYSFSDLQTSTAPSKFLLYYIIGIFEIPQNMPGWVTRTPVALFTMIGASSLYALARFLFSKAVGLLAMLIYLTLPFMIFYERLVLSDPVAASLVAFVAWWSLVYAKYPTRRNSIILAILLCFMLAAKILAAPLLALPVLAIILFHRYAALTWDKTIVRQLVQEYKPYWGSLKLMGIIVGVVWGVIMAFYQIRMMLTPESTSPIVDRYLYEGLRRGLGVSENPYALEVWELNFERLWQIVYRLWHPVMIWAAALTFPFLILKHPRKTLYLAYSVVVIWAIILFTSGQLSTRYTILPAHLLIVLVAASIYSAYETLLKPLSQRTIWLVVGFVGVWMAVFSSGFYMTLVDRPEALAMPERDTYEYFENQTGYALRDVLLDVSKMPSVSEGSDIPIVYGMVRNCFFLWSHIPADTNVNIQCSKQYAEWPRRDWPDSQERYTDVESLADEYGAVYVIMEEFSPPMIERWRLNANLKFVKSYPRPYNGVPVNLYIATPRDPMPSGIPQKP